MPEIFPHSFVLFNSYFAGVYQCLDFFHIGHNEIAIYLLDEDGFHLDRLQLVQEDFTHFCHVLLATEDSQLSEFIHLKDFIDEKLLVELKVHVIFWVHSEERERLLLVANQLPNEILWHLQLLNFKLMQSILDMELVMNLEDLVRAVLNQSAYMMKLILRADNLQSHI
jgi:hypothetical protein